MKACAAAALAALAAAGCGYTAGRAHDVRTVAVRVAGNETFRQRLELPLTRALQEALVVYGGYRPAAAADADAVLEVVIGDVRSSALVAGRPEPLSEGSLTFAVRARLVPADPARPATEFAVTDRAEFRVAVGEGEPDAVREAAADLARKIVLGLDPGM